MFYTECRVLESKKLKFCVFSATQSLFLWSVRPPEFNQKLNSCCSDFNVNWCWDFWSADIINCSTIAVAQFHNWQFLSLDIVFVLKQICYIFRFKVTSKQEIAWCSTLFEKMKTICGWLGASTPPPFGLGSTSYSLWALCVMSSNTGLEFCVSSYFYLFKA